MLTSQLIIHAFTPPQYRDYQNGWMLQGLDGCETRPQAVEKSKGYTYPEAFLLGWDEALESQEILRRPPPIKWDEATGYPIYPPYTWSGTYPEER